MEVEEEVCTTCELPLNQTSVTTIHFSGENKLVSSVCDETCTSAHSFMRALTLYLLGQVVATCDDMGKYGTPVKDAKWLKKPVKKVPGRPGVFQVPAPPELADEETVEVQ
jgi:hypothetical protein